MAAKIREESKGLLRLDKFTKMNGQKANINGIDVYTMECSVDVVANQACAMTGFQLGGGWDGSFGALKAQKGGAAIDAFNPFGAGYGTNKQLAGGAHMTFNLNLQFDLTERGWRTEGRLPTNVAFKPDEPLQEPEPETRKPQDKQQYSQLIIGSWLGRKIRTYRKDGIWCIQRYEGAPADTEGRKWSLKGDKLTYTSPGGNGTDTIISLTSDALSLRDEDGNIQRFKRLSK